MSDNEYSDIEIDIESNSPMPPSVCSNSSSHVDPKLHARAQHNALERRRRDNIKDMYTSLKDEIVNFNHERASRAQILCKTIDQMKELKDDVEQLETTVKEMEEESERLERELQELEAAEASCRSTPERTTS